MKKNIQIIIILTLLCLYGCNMTKYDDYSSSTLQNNREMHANSEKVVESNLEWQLYPYDTIFVEDYTSRMVLKTREDNLDIIVKDSCMVKDMTYYEHIGGTDKELLNWISHVDFNSIYDSDNNIFLSSFSGINMNIYIVSINLTNNSGSDKEICIDDLRFYLIDKENNKCRRMAAYEDVFHDFSTSVGSDRTKILIKAGEHKDVVMFFIEPDKDIIKYIVTPEGNVTLESKKYNKDNIYMRLSVLGKNDICNEEYFVKIKSE